MLQPVSLIMSQVNLENRVQTPKEAYSAALDTGQNQEAVKESIRRVQTVQANEASAEAQRVRRRNDEEQREDRRRNSRDSFEHEQRDKKREGDEPEQEPELVLAPVIEREPEDLKLKRFNFMA